MIQKLKTNILKLLFSLKGSVRFGPGVYVNRKSVFEGRNYIYNNTRVIDSFLGLGTYIAPNSKIHKVRIGRFCSIGSNVMTYIGSHPSRDFVSTHPAFFSRNAIAGFTFTEKQLFEEHTYVDTEHKFVVFIGNDVWIGNSVSILDGVTVGDGAIIGLGALVTRDVEPYSITLGVPSKKVSYRFDEKDRDFLMQLQWWNKDLEWIKKHASLFNDVQQLKKRLSPI